MGLKAEWREQRKESVNWKIKQQKLPTLNNEEEKNAENKTTVL